MKSLAIIVTHPIQYYVPLFKLLNKYCELKVFYTWGVKGAAAKYDPGFNKTVAWDVPLLEGYAYEFLTNTAKDPGSHHYNGIVNPELIETVHTFKPDVILVYGWAYKSHLAALRHFKGKTPIWFRGDSTLLDERKGFKQILRGLFLKWVYSHVDLAFYVGSANKKYFKKFGMQERQLIFTPHAIDNERFAEDRGDEAHQIRASFNIKNDDVLILFAGKLERKKNPELLLEAFIELDSSVVDRPSSLDQQEEQKEESLMTKEQGSKNKEQLDTSLAHRLSTLAEQKKKREKHPELHLLFVGNGELEEELKAKSRKQKEKLEKSFDFLPAGQIGAQDDKLEVDQGDSVKTKNEKSRLPDGQGKTNIHFMDFQNQTQMPAVYQACDLFCLPSHGPGETWGLAVNEAMACKKAALVADKVGCAQDLVAQETGLIFKSNDIDDLKQKLIALTSDKNNLSEIGKSAQQHIQNWSFKEQLKAILNQLNG
ncbi:glycosyltransferase [Pedobacter frigiditerrae]|uniref:Glycosyltransferase n=1 Tax=Pedobacter frigiditerrae TaxID=2530452 RepID=A0A4R0MY70_9SPHI|nr:glycosyltransferase family 4 protein [Pedobacter frigiditerrae]TCC92261.1 glycosyltransferase [Pedobacter frigiditerrae]